MIYADWCATAPLHPAARAVLSDWLNTPVPANPSSLHTFGMDAADRLTEARTSLAGTLHWNGEITFTSGGTEADGLAVYALIRRYRNTGRRRIVLSPLEHPAVREAVYSFAPAAGMAVEECAVTPYGTVDIPDFAARIGEDLAFAAVMTVQNETGVIQPVNELAELTHSCGGAFFTDAVQAAGHIPLPEKADVLTLSAHKFGGPAGVGALLHRGEMTPLLKGGGQEKGLRGGTENVPGICAMAAALAHTALPDWMAETRDRLEEQFLARMHQAGIPARIAGKNTPRIGSVTCAVFGGKSGSPVPDGENLVLSCDLAGLAVSAGSACHSGSSTPSRVLTAMGYEEEEALREVRLSFGDGTTVEEMERAYRILGDTALRLYGGKE